MNLATPGLWAKMLEKQTEARFWKPPWPLDLQVGVVWVGEHPYHCPPPPAVQAAPSVLVRLAPKTRPPPPSRPRPAWGCSPGENDVHCGWRQQLSWSWGIRTGPQGSHRLEEATRGWVQLHGPGSRDAATWLPGDVATRSHPGRSLRWSLRQPLPGPASPSGLGGLNQPCAGPGGVAERLPLSR